MVAYGIQKVKRPPRKKKYHVNVPQHGGHIKEVKHTSTVRLKTGRAKMKNNLKNRGR